MEIRLFRDSDEDAIVALWTEVLPSDAPHNAPVASIRQKHAVEDALFFVADDAGTIVGTVMGGYDGHRGWIYSVATAPAYRHRGIGTALLRRVEAALAARGCLKVNLQVVTSNASVVTFYEKLGYTVEPRISMGKLLY